MPSIAFRCLSWNLDNFGKYNYHDTMQRIAQTIIDTGVDFAIIMELFCGGGKKKVALGEGDVAEAAAIAVNQLWEKLKALDPGSDWDCAISNTNCANHQRDGYGFYWKKTPHVAIAGPYLAPTSIEMLEGPYIFTEDANNVQLKFAGSRRPGGCLFRLTNNGAEVKQHEVWVCGYHAYAEIKEKTKIKNATRDCITVIEATANHLGAGTPVVIGGDFNLNYNTNQDFYDHLPDSYDVSIKDGVGTSLKSNPNFNVAVPVLADMAYDNFFSRRLDLLAPPSFKPGVINVVAIMAKEKYDTQKGKKKRPMNEIEQELWPMYKTKDTNHCCSVSDHFPVIAGFGFNP